MSEFVTKCVMSSLAILFLLHLQVLMANASTTDAATSEATTMAANTGPTNAADTGMTTMSQEMTTGGVEIHGVSLFISLVVVCNAYLLA